MPRLELALLAITLAAHAANYPEPRDADFAVRNFQFTSGEKLPAVKLHYTTLGTPNGNNAVLIMHGTGGAGFRFCFNTAMFCSVESLVTNRAKYRLVASSIIAIILSLSPRPSS